jgi:hypothetical protein
MLELEEKPSALKKEHPALHKMKFVDHFCPPGSGLDPDSDPQHCLQNYSPMYYIGI